MNPLLINALGLSLVHFLWEGAALAVALLLFHRASARSRYAAACAALFAMPVAFAATFYRFWHVSGLWLGPRLTPHLGGPLDVTAGGGSGTSAGASIWAWLVPIWMAGVAIFYLRSMGGWWAARRLRHTGVTAAPDVWQTRLAALRARTGVTHAVALMESCLTEVPVVIGYFRPVILLPIGLASGLSTEQVEALLIHELSHIRRHDYLVNLLQSAVEGLLFYHPAVWWVSRVIRTEREHCCDDAVVALRGDARGYAGALAAMESLRAPAAALAANGGSLVHRVRRLLRQPEGPQGSPAATVAVAILLAGTLTALSAWQQSAPPKQPVLTAQQVQKKQGDANTSRADNTNPYRKWLTEDVAYIITTEERRAFRNLQSDEEREHFIEQFWQRRNPVPGSQENAFKEEHYRRIAYVNQSLEDADGLAGWKTDRGRVYISYGPPDEKEVHPSGNPPYEQWLYHYIEGVGQNIIVEFREQNGRMLMTSDPHGQGNGRGR
jgi:GWxTD domain-containing protein